MASSPPIASTLNGEPPKQHLLIVRESDNEVRGKPETDAECDEQCSALAKQQPQERFIVYRAMSVWSEERVVRRTWATNGTR